MDRRVVCNPEKLLNLEDILRIINFNVGKIVYLQQEKPISHHYTLEIITGDLLVVTDQTTEQSETVNKKEFIEKFGQCHWAKIEGIGL